MAEQKQETKMQFTVNRKQFHDALAIASQAIKTNSVKPVLANAKVVISDGLVSISGTNLEQYVTARCSAETEGEGTLLFMPEPITRFLQSCSSDTVTVRESKSGAEIVSERSRYAFATAGADDFPNMPEPVGSVFEVDGESLAVAFERAIISADRTDKKYMLTAIHLELSAGESFAVCTNGHALTAVPLRVTCIAGKSEAMALLPKECERMVRSVCSGTCKIRMSDNAAVFDSDSATVITRLVEGRYPKWRMAIPGSHPHRVEVPSAPFMSALRQASVAATQEVPYVILKFSSGMLQMSSTVNGQQSESEMPLGCDFEASVRLDVDYLRDFISVVPSAAVIDLQMKDSESSVVLSIADGTRHVIMAKAMDE